MKMGIEIEAIQTLTLLTSYKRYLEKMPTAY